VAIIRQGKPRNIAIHHSAVLSQTGDLTELKNRVASHNNYHKTKSEGWNNTTLGEFGYKWIRYHWAISRQGDILQLQDEKYVLYHSGDGSKGEFNYWGIAILFEGNFQEQQPTENMMKSAVKLIREIEKRYGIDPKVRGHKEVSSTATSCPGVNLGTSQSGWIKSLITNVNDKNYKTDPTPPPVTPPQEPTTPPEAPNWEEMYKEAQSEIEGLKIEIGASKGRESLLEDRVEKLEMDMKILNQEAKDLRNDYDRVLEEKQRFEKEKLDLQKELDELRQGRDTWINRLADILHKLFSRK
jgi:hypothetical protein